MWIDLFSVWALHGLFIPPNQTAAALLKEPTLRTTLFGSDSSLESRFSSSDLAFLFNHPPLSLSTILQINFLPSATPSPHTYTLLGVYTPLTVRTASATARLTTWLVLPTCIDFFLFSVRGDVCFPPDLRGKRLSGLGVRTVLVAVLLSGCTKDVRHRQGHAYACRERTRVYTHTQSHPHKGHKLFSSA